jgi:hypothetical protein
MAIREKIHKRLALSGRQACGLDANSLCYRPRLPPCRRKNGWPRDGAPVPQEAEKES